MFFARLLAAGAVAIVAVSAFAQPAAPTPSASAPMMDCQKKARHDHGAEKGTPTPKSSACADMPGPAASAARKKPLHDHGKMHKQQ
ncbi:hypothetical protein [Aquabacterium humicola]|uniref:hypothetical protein n=1 Tax=Aquabacterium humicola TaxID=3237377 RepID=UPI002543AF1E|nr:hypothetical protein [Rubrivivax pictus]